MADKKDKAIEALKEAGKRARAGAKKAADAAKSGLNNARKALKESKHRRKIEAAEVAIGSLGAAAAHGMDLTIDYDDMKIPAGAVGGGLVLAAGAAAGEPDAEALGFGALVYGVSRFVEDKVRDWNNDTTEGS